MADEHDREIRHLRELVDTRETALKTALELQAREYERRLDGLNHAHTRALDAAQKSVSRELYDSDQKACRIYNEGVAKDIEILRREVSVDLAKRAGRAEMVAVFAFIFSLLAPLVTRVLFP